MNGSLPISVQSFLDVYLYLQEVYQYRKSHEPKFSYETWAQELGLTSKSYLRFAILGKRKISPELTLKFCANIGLGKVDREYFTLLVLYTQCAEPQQKRILGEKLTSSLKRNVQFENHPDSHDLVSNPFFLILRNYLSFADAPKSKADLVKIFGISDEEVDLALRTLEEAGAISFDGKEWITNSSWVRVGTNPGSKALVSYHNSSLMKAITAQSLDPSERSYRSLSFALNASEYKELLADLNDFAANVCSSYDPASLDQRRIYQLNFNLIPWTEKVVTGKDSVRVSEESTTPAISN